MEFSINRFDKVDSTNRLAAEGKPGEVFVAAEQSAGRGRLDHKWHSRPGENLLMSIVLDVSSLPPAEVATLPLLAGLSVVKAIDELTLQQKLTANSQQLTAVQLKWPNDVYLNSHKVCGILCERHGDNVVVGVGVNVRQRDFPDELRVKATSLLLEGIDVSVDGVMNRVLESLTTICKLWVSAGFAALYPAFSEIDFLKGRAVTVMRTDDDREPVRGICGGITDDGSLLVGDEKIYAGEVRW